MARKEGDIVKIGDVANRSEVFTCFPVEIKVRDLDSRLYLAAKFATAGHPALIGRINNVDDEIFKLKAPFIYFSKGFMPQRDHVYANIRKHGGKLIYMDEEGGFYKKNWDVYMWRSDDRILKHVDLYLAWGEALKEVLLEKKKNITADRIEVTGHPRFDLRKPEFADFYRKVRTVKVPNKYILFNCAFGLGNEILTREYDYQQLYDYRKDLFGEYFNTFDFERSYHFQRLTLSYFLEAIEAVANKNPEISVVVRPHPSENIETYQSRLTANNIIITKEGSVQEWNVDASAVIHVDCTTSVEALLNEIPIISYTPACADDVITHIPFGISKRVKTLDDLLHEVNYYLNSEEKSPIQDWQATKLRPFLDNIDYSSANRIVDLVCDKFSNLTYLDIHFIEENETLKKKVSVYELLANPYRKLRAFKNNIVHPPKKKSKIKSNRAKEKFSGLSLEEVEHRIKLFKQIDPSIGSISVTQTEKDLFTLRAEKL